MAAFGGAPIASIFSDIPPVTKTYIILAAITTAACQLDWMHPSQLMFSKVLIWKGGQYWRLASTFLFFGKFDFDLIYHLFFLVRYSRLLEEDSFRGRSSDYAWFLIFSAFLMLCAAPYIQLPYLSSALVSSMVYLWSRRNPHVQLSFLGLLNLTAPYLPWVMFAFSSLISNRIATKELLGIAVGHVYYFLDDVYPRMRGGRNIIRAQR